MRSAWWLAVLTLMGCGRTAVVAEDGELLALTHLEQTLRLDALVDGVVTPIATLPRRDHQTYGLDVDPNGAWALVNAWTQGNAPTARDVWLVELATGATTALEQSWSHRPFRDQTWRRDAPGLRYAEKLVDLPSLKLRALASPECVVVAGLGATALARCDAGTTQLVDLGTGDTRPGPPLTDDDRVLGLSTRGVVVSTERGACLALRVLSERGEEVLRHDLGCDEATCNPEGVSHVACRSVSGGLTHRVLWNAERDSLEQLDCPTTTGVGGSVLSVGNGGAVARLSCDGTSWELHAPSGVTLSAQLDRLPLLPSIDFDATGTRVLISEPTRTFGSLEATQLRLWDLTTGRELPDPRTAPLGPTSSLAWRRR